MRFRNTEILVKKGDITLEIVDAIVNSANSRLLAGGGVDGAIHRAAGPSLLEECRIIADGCGGCPPGEAVITTGGKLRAKKVIHTVGPVWYGGSHQEEVLLRNCYLRSLILAETSQIKTITFPSISTGAYGFPIEKAAPIAVQAVIDFVIESDAMKQITFILFSDEDYALYQKIIEVFQKENES